MVPFSEHFLSASFISPMVRSALLCFRPFSLAGQSLCPLSTQDACAFYSFLSDDLRRLEQSLAEGSVSLRWSVEAMNFLKRMQIELLALFKKSNMPIAFGAEEDWFNQYMQETATLLDFCNSLKSAISGINRYRMVIDLAIQKIVQGNSACVMCLEDIDLRRAESKHGSFLRSRMVTETVTVGREVEFKGSSKTDKSIAAVMLAAKCTMVVVSVLLSSAMVSPLSIDMGSEELTSKFPQLKQFVKMLTALVVRFHERALKPKNGSRLVLAEREMVDSVVGDLRAQAVRGVVEKEKFLMSAEMLRTSSDELREGIEMFDAVVDEVFEVVIKGRNEMLGVFRDGALCVG